MDPFEPREVKVMVRPVSVCPGFQADGVTEVSPSNLCAAVDEGGKDSCQVSPGLILVSQKFFFLE